MAIVPVGRAPSAAIPRSTRPAEGLAVRPLRRPTFPYSWLLLPRRRFQRMHIHLILRARNRFPDPNGSRELLVSEVGTLLYSAPDPVPRYSQRVTFWRSAHEVIR